MQAAPKAILHWQQVRSPTARDHVLEAVPPMAEQAQKSASLPLVNSTESLAKPECAEPQVWTHEANLKP